MDGHIELLIVILAFIGMLFVGKLFWEKLRHRGCEERLPNPSRDKMLKVIFESDAKVIFFKGARIDCYHTWSIIRDAKGDVHFIGESTGVNKWH
jgi:hypothetical protein